METRLNSKRCSGRAHPASASSENSTPRERGEGMDYSRVCAGRRGGLAAAVVPLVVLAGGGVPGGVAGGGGGGGGGAQGNGANEARRWRGAALRGGRAEFLAGDSR